MGDTNGLGAWLSRQAKEDPYGTADAYADSYGVPREHIRRVMTQESGGRVNARSPKGALGPMQVMPGTAASLGFNPNDPAQNIEAGVKYFKQQLDEFGDPKLAAAAYNSGPGRVRRAGGIPRIRETQKYAAGFGEPIPNATGTDSPQPIPNTTKPPVAQDATPTADPTAGLSEWLAKEGVTQPAEETAPARPKRGGTAAEFDADLAGFKKVIDQGGGPEAAHTEAQRLKDKWGEQLEAGVGQGGWAYVKAAAPKRGHFNITPEARKSEFNLGITAAPPTGPQAIMQSQISGRPMQQPSGFPKPQPRRFPTGGPGLMQMMQTATEQKAADEAEAARATAERGSNYQDLTAALGAVTGSDPDAIRKFLPQRVTETLADLVGPAIGSVGETIKGAPSLLAETNMLEAPDFGFSDITGLKDTRIIAPFIKKLLQPAADVAGEPLMRAGGEVDQYGGPEGIVKDVAQGIGGGAPQLLAMMAGPAAPVVAAELQYAQSKGRGATDAQAMKDAGIAGVTFAAMHAAGGPIERAVPGLGLTARVARYGLRAAANVAAPMAVEAPINYLEGKPLVDTKRLGSSAVLGLTYAGMPGSDARALAHGRARLAAQEAMARPGGRLALPPAPPEALRAAQADVGAPQGPFAAPPSAPENIEGIPAYRRIPATPQGAAPMEPRAPGPQEAIPTGRLDTESKLARFQGRARAREAPPGEPIRAGEPPPELPTVPTARMPRPGQPGAPTMTDIQPPEVVPPGTPRAPMPERRPPFESPIQRPEIPPRAPEGYRPSRPPGEYPRFEIPPEPEAGTPEDLARQGYRPHSNQLKEESATERAAEINNDPANRLEAKVVKVADGKYRVFVRGQGEGAEPVPLIPKPAEPAAAPVPLIPTPPEAPAAEPEWEQRGSPRYTLDDANKFAAKIRRDPTVETQVKKVKGGYQVSVRDKPAKAPAPAKAPVTEAPAAAPEAPATPPTEEPSTFRHPTEGTLRLSPDQTRLARGVVAFDQVMPGGASGRRVLLNRAAEADKGIEIPTPPPAPEHQVGATVEWNQPAPEGKVKVLRGIVQAEPDNRGKVQVVDSNGRRRSVNRDDLRVSTEPVTVNVQPSAPRDMGVKKERDSILEAIRKIGVSPEAKSEVYDLMKENGQLGNMNQERTTVGQRKGDDHLLEALKQDGYISKEGDHAELIDKVEKELGGKRQLSTAYDHDSDLAREYQEISQANRHPETRMDTKVFDARKNEPEFREVLDKLYSTEYTAEDGQRFEEIARRKAPNGARLSDGFIDNIRTDAEGYRAALAERGQAETDEAGNLRGTEAGVPKDGGGTSPEGTPIPPGEAGVPAETVAPAETPAEPLELKPTGPAEIPKGEHGHLANALFRRPIDPETGKPIGTHAFWDDPEVRAALGMKPLGDYNKLTVAEKRNYSDEMKNTRRVLANKLGKPGAETAEGRSSYIDPAELREWADKNLKPGGNAMVQLEHGESVYNTKKAARAAKDQAARERLPAEAPQFVKDAQSRLNDTSKPKLPGGSEAGSTPAFGDLIDAAIVHGYKLYRGAKDFVDWSKQMVAQLGDGIEEHLPGLYQALRYGKVEQWRDGLIKTEPPSGKGPKSETNDYKWDAENQEFARRPTVTPSGHTMDDFIKVADSADKEEQYPGRFGIGKIKIKLTPAERAIEARNAFMLEADPEHFIDTYKKNNTRNGVLTINTDEARKQFPDWNQTHKTRATRAAAVQEPAGALASTVWREALKEPPADGRRDILVLAGGGGSGKSYAAENVPEVKKLKDDAWIVYDTTLADLKSSRAKIREAQEHGAKVHIRLIYTPENIAAGKAYERAVQPDRGKGEGGRTVPKGVLAKDHFNAPSTVLKLAEELKDAEGSSVGAIYNDGRSMPHEVSLDKVKEITHNRTSEEVLRNIEGGLNDKRREISNDENRADQPDDKRLKPEHLKGYIDRAFGIGAGGGGEPEVPGGHAPDNGRAKGEGEPRGVGGANGAQPEIRGGAGAGVGEHLREPPGPEERLNFGDQPPPPKDKPVVVVYGGSFNPTHLGHVAIPETAKALLEHQGYNVRRVIVAPSGQSLLEPKAAKTGDTAMPFADRADLAKVAFGIKPGEDYNPDTRVQVSTGPAEEAEGMTGKLRRTQLADWAQKQHPDATVINLTGADANVPGDPKQHPALYQGAQESAHEGYHYLTLPRGEGDLSSSAIRNAIKRGEPLPEGHMTPEMEQAYREKAPPPAAPREALDQAKTDKLADAPQWVKDAQERLNTPSPELSGPEVGATRVFTDLIDAAVVHGYKLYRGAKDFTDWSRQMVDQLGDGIKEHLQGLWHSIKTGAVEEWRNAQTATTPEGREGEAGFVRVGGGKQAVTNERLKEIFEANKGKERVPLSKTQQAMADAWEEFDTGTRDTGELHVGETEAGEKPAKPKLPDKVASLHTADALMKANLLAGLSPYTHKVGSLLSNLAGEALSRPGAALTDYLTSLGTGRRGVMADVRGMANAAYDGVTKGVREYGQIMRYGATKEQLKNDIMPNELNTRNPLVNAAVNYTFRSYKAGAHIAGTVAYSDAMSNQAKVLAVNEARAGKIPRRQIDARAKEILAGKNIPEGAIATMEGHALIAYTDAVFQSDNKLNDVSKAIKNIAGPRWQFVANRLVPFAKSASNAYLKALDYAGVGPKGAMAETVRAISRRLDTGQAFTNTADQAAFSKAWGKLPVGAGLFALGIALHRNGMMTSLTYDHDDNPQPGSFRIGKKLVDVARYSPLGLLMAMGATFDEQTRQKGQDVGTGALATAVKGASNLPMFSQAGGIGQTASELASGKIKNFATLAKSGAANLATPAIPAYSTVRDIKAGFEKSDKYVGGPIGKMLHIEREEKPPRTDTQRRVEEAYRETLPRGQMTPDEHDAAVVKAQLLEAMRTRAPDVGKKITAAMESGIVSGKEMESLMDRATLSRTQDEFKHTTSLPRAVALYESLDADGRRELRDEFLQKLGGMDELPPVQAQKLIPKIRELLKGQ